MTQESLAKIEAAKPLILGGMPIWRAAVEVGWASPQLQIAFKKAEGMTPGQWLWSMPVRIRERAYGRTLEHSEIYAGLHRRRLLESTRVWMCASCGESFESKPDRCAKCGCYSFDLSAPVRVGAELASGGAP